MPASALATIAGLAIASGVDVESIRLYHQAGLLPQPRRLSGHDARHGYHKDHLARLKFIRRARGLGFSLEAIAGLLGLRSGLATCGDAFRIASRHLDEIRGQLADPAVAANPGKVAELTRIESALAPLLKSCPNNGSASSCTVLRALSGT